jgi:hypothetical protein
MKKQIGKVGNTVTYAEIQPIAVLPGWRHVKITSVWEDANHPSEHTKFDMCMDPDTFAELKSLINKE